MKCLHLVHTNCQTLSIYQSHCPLNRQHTQLYYTILLLRYHNITPPTQSSRTNRLQIAQFLRQPSTTHILDYAYKHKMVLGLLSIASIPTVTGTALAVSEQRKANERKNDARRMAKFHIDAECTGDTQEDCEVNGRRVVLRNNKVYVDDVQSSASQAQSQSHTAECFYIDYPETDETKHLKRGLGLVTTISNNPPALGWIYVDKNTHELKYGNRSQSIEHVVGPWDWTDDEKTVILEDKKGAFLAVEENGSGWGLYFDRDGDELEVVLEEQGKLDNAFTPVIFRRRLIE